MYWHRKYDKICLNYQAIINVKQSVHYFLSVKYGHKITMKVISVPKKMITNRYKWQVIYLVLKFRLHIVAIKQCIIGF